MARLEPFRSSTGGDPEKRLFITNDQSETLSGARNVGWSQFLGLLVIEIQRLSCCKISGLIHNLWDWRRV